MIMPNEQAARLADHMVALKDGTIHAHGTPQEVVTEELLAAIFEIDAEVGITDHGPRVTPIRARHDNRNSDSKSEQ